MAIIVALSLPVLAGAAAVAVDIGIWQTDQLNDQRAADAAAFSAGIDKNAGDSSTGITATAKAIAAQYGLVDGSAGVTVTVNTPPSTGAYTSNNNALEVIIKKQETLLFAPAIAWNKPVTTTGRAVAGASKTAFCVLSLDPTATADTTNLSNNAQVHLVNCSFAVDGTNAAALHLTGSAGINAVSTSVVGSYATDNGGAIVGPVSTGVAYIADPYVSVAMPTAAACPNSNAIDYTAWHSGPITLNPGTYCGGMYFANGNTIYLNPGVYIVYGTATSTVPSAVSGNCSVNQFCLQGGDTVQQTPSTVGGVTIVLTGSSGHYATMNIANGTTMTITAPISGTTAGIAFFADRASPSTSVETFAGGAYVNVTGAMYFPSQTVSLSNGTVNNSAVCTQLIGYDFPFTGGMTFGNTCSNTGTTPIGNATVKLLE